MFLSRVGMARFSFDCIFYYVGDLEKSVEFYTDVLGFRLFSRDVLARFYIDGVLFELIPGHGERKFRGDGNARLCLKVENIDEAVAYLRRKGTLTSQPKQESNGRIASFEDPDGNEICLWQYT
jgi:catechol 2,3-dioxygenase-like lactoylglutathione lyase family enzyme